MQSTASDLVRSKMESLRLICERDVPIEMQRMDSFVASFCESLDSIKARVEETVQNQGKLREMKSGLREAEDEFVKVLAVKTRKEAKQMATREYLSATRARIEELKRNLQVLRARRDEYAVNVSQNSPTLATVEGKGNQDSKAEIQEAILWYMRVLGCEIQGGHGVKFTFININTKNPSEEYSFTIRHENDTYTLLSCDPQLNDTKDLIYELNRTNGLFTFVRTMRQKFQEAASFGLLPQSSNLHQVSSTISVSAPVLSISTDGCESPMNKNEYSFEESKRHSKKANYRRGIRKSLSPGSVRRSPRFKV